MAPRPADGAAERREPVLVSQVDAGIGQRSRYRGPAMERRPAERGRIVLGIEQRRVRAMLEEEARGVRLAEFGGDVQRIDAAGVGFAARVGERAIAGEQLAQRREVAALYGVMELRYLRSCLRHTAIRSRQGVRTCETTSSASPAKSAIAGCQSSGATPE